MKRLLLMHLFLIFATSIFSQSTQENRLVDQQEAAKYKADGVVRYSDFGAVGDGKSDDLEAIAAAHTYANEHNLSVEADALASYYIGNKELTVNIQTNTDFKNATFILDDTEVKNIKLPIFRITSKLPTFIPEGISSLKKNQRKIPISIYQPHLITLSDSTIKRYRRKGPNQNNGHAQTDIFVVDSDGRVDPKTPIIWDFDQITEIKAIPIDTATLIVTGGKFLTIANQAESKYTYYARNIEILRSNVIIDSLEHLITGEGDQGAPYTGFFSVRYCANVRIQNTKVSGHKTYKTIGSANKTVSMGSYDINLNHAINVTFENCHQLNSINDRKIWGIMGSNFCKNITLSKCTFSRFDAHQGVTNAKIINSSIGYVGIRAIGHGTFTIENTTVRARNFVSFRQDYGSTWDGDFIIKNCVFIPTKFNPKDIALFQGSNNGKHDFGYTSSLPTQFVIEGLEIRDDHYDDSYERLVLFSDFNPEMTNSTYKEEYPYIVPKKVVLENINSLSGKILEMSTNQFMFKDTKMICR